jgi:hypothetical protein
MDQIIQNFKDSIDSSIKIDANNTIAIKISSFGEIEKLKKYNQIQNILSIIEDGIIDNLSDESILANVIKCNIDSKSGN